MKIFLTGASGFIGSNILRVGQELFDVEFLACVHTWQPQSPPSFQFAHVNLENREAVMESVLAFRPDVIVHSAIVNDLDLIYRDRELAWRMYVEATHNLTDAANAIGAKIILVSTDWVFDGNQGGATEATPPNPINYYGVLKVASERVVAERGKNWAVARVAGVSGIHWLRRQDTASQNRGFGYLANALVHAWRAQDGFTVWTGKDVNRRATPGLGSDCAEMILKIGQLDAQGIFHCTGGESVERTEYAKRIADTFAYDPACILSGDPSDKLPQGARVPDDTSLNAEYTAWRLKHSLLTVQELVDRFKHEYETGELSNA
jgi:dTDP-4-dehydrorhamnose reductase